MNPPLPRFSLEDLIGLLRARRDDVRGRWQRVLPVGEYLSDRWEKAQALGFGEGASIYDSAVVLGDVTVGPHTWIGPFTLLDGTGGLTIGAYCSVSAGVHVYTHDTVNWATSGGVAPVRRAPVHIGDRCYLGPNVVVAMGVTIGAGCVVGANSFVNRDVPPGVRAWGTPARVIGPAESGSPE